MITLIIFILLLALLVLIHEFGHFIAAKKNGIYVEEFGFGFPPRVIGKKIGETLYSLNLLPIGGFVKVYGEEYHEEDKGVDKMADRAFINKKPWQKAVVVLAGVFMNIVLAVFIYYVLLGINNFKSDPFTLFGDYKFRFGTQQEQIVVANVVKNAPAAKSGVTIGDVVQRVKSETSDTWTDISTPDQMIKYVNNAQGQKVAIELINLKDDQKKTVTVVPQYNKELKRAAIGVGLAQSVVLTYNQPVQKIFSGFLHSYNIMSYSMNTMGYFISSSFKQRSLGPVSETVSGPVGIFQVVGDIVEFSGSKLLVNLAQLAALLSLSLATMNVFPFPALDGGRLVFILYEWITGKRPNQTIEKYVNMIGFFVLIALAIVISINDVIRLMR